MGTGAFSFLATKFAFLESGKTKSAIETTNSVSRKMVKILFISFYVLN